MRDAARTTIDGAADQLAPLDPRLDRLRSRFRGYLLDSAFGAPVEPMSDDGDVTLRR